MKINFLYKNYLNLLGTQFFLLTRIRLKNFFLDKFRWNKNYLSGFVDSHLIPYSTSVALTYADACSFGSLAHITDPFILLGQLASTYYFSFFVFLVLAICVIITKLISYKKNKNLRTEYSSTANFKTLQINVLMTFEIQNPYGFLLDSHSLDPKTLVILLTVFSIIAKIADFVTKVFSKGKKKVASGIGKIIFWGQALIKKYKSRIIRAFKIFLLILILTIDHFTLQLFYRILLQSLFSIIYGVFGATITFIAFFTVLPFLEGIYRFFIYILNFFN